MKVLGRFEDVSFQMEDKELAQAIGMDGYRIVSADKSGNTWIIQVRREVNP